MRARAWQSGGNAVAVAARTSVEPMSWLTTLMRRLLWLTMLGAAGGAAYSWWRARATPATAGPAVWPPLGSDPGDEPGRRAGAEARAAMSGAAPGDTSAPAPTSSAVSASATADERAWVEPDGDGACPLTHPIKANDNSGIFHVPGGRFYERTRAERCYTTAQAATDDGYRQAKA